VPNHQPPFALSQDLALPAEPRGRCEALCLYMPGGGEDRIGDVPNAGHRSCRPAHRPVFWIRRISIAPRPKRDITQMTFASPRRGWARRLKDWKPTYQEILRTRRQASVQIRGVPARSEDRPPCKLHIRPTRRYGPYNKLAVQDRTRRYHFR